MLIIFIFIPYFCKHILRILWLQCMKGLLVDADQILIALQNGLSQQEVNFATFIEQQHEVHYLLQNAKFLPIY